jgi:flagellar assembly protein FliH
LFRFNLCKAIVAEDQKVVVDPERGERVGHDGVSDTEFPEGKAGVTEESLEALRAAIEKDRESILQEAHKERVRILEEARKEAQVLKKQGFEEGFLQGKEEAKKEAYEALQKKIVLWESVLQEIKRVREASLFELKELILELSLAIAERIIRREAKREPFFANLIEEALQKLNRRERVVLRVHPLDVALLKDIKEELCSKLDGLEYLEIREDARCARGDFLVETDFGSIDGRVDTQLHWIKKELLEEIQSKNA